MKISPLQERNAELCLTEPVTWKANMQGHFDLPYDNETLLHFGSHECHTVQTNSIN
jgi:hypothetical protein